MPANNDRTIRINDDNVLKLLLKLSVPATVAMLVNALYNVVDRAFVGNGVGFDAVGGITVAFPYVLISLAFIQLIGVGSVTHFSINLGKKKLARSEIFFFNGFIMLIVSSLFISTVGLFNVRGIVEAFAGPGTSEAIKEYARQYLTIILIGMVFQAVALGMNNFIRAQGSSTYAMMSVVTGAVLNVILNALFVFVFRAGVKGAALATIISQVCSALIVMYYFVCKDRSIFRFRYKWSMIHFRIMKQIVTTGFSAFAFQLATSLLFVFLNNFLAYLGGDNAVIAMGIIYAIMTVILMPLFGINQGLHPIVGFNYGARNFKRVKQTLFYGIMFSTGIVCATYVLTFFMPHLVIRLFGKDSPEIIDLGAKCLKIFLFLLPLLGFQVVGSNFFQAIGKSKIALLLNMSRQVLVYIPALILIPIMKWGLDGILYAGPVSDLVAFVLTAVILYKEIQRINKEEAELATDSTTSDQTPIQ